MAAAQQGEVLGLITGYTLSSLGISSNIDRPPDHKASMTPPEHPDTNGFDALTTFANDSFGRPWR